MSVDNNLLTYNNDATFSGNTEEWYITCTSSGRITAKVDMYFDVFIVGGGGGGGGGSTQSWDSAGGGGGGGGYRVTKRGLFLSAGSYADIIVGAGGNAGANGGASTAFGYTANGGGAGGNATNRYFDGASWIASVPGQGGSGGANGGKGVYINGYAGYVSSEAGSNGGYAFDDSTWSSTKYGAGGGGGSAATNSDNSYGDIIWGYYLTRNSGNVAPGGETGGGLGSDIFGPGWDATNYGGGGGGGGCRSRQGGKGYQGIVIIRSARGGYSLDINQGNGSLITIQRTTSNESDVRRLNHGAKIYSGDVLRITFESITNYELLTHTVNGSDFPSGNTYSVSGDTTVAATARPLASSVGATDANIGSTSTVTITKYVDTYYHSLQYSFGSLSGYIASDGSISATEVKFSSTSVAFTLPSSFYTQIPNAKTGVCTITCRTYETHTDTTVLGDPSTCIFTATAAESACAPVVSGVVVDTNNDTIALTGDSDILVRFKSNVQCTITATAQNSSSIASTKINGRIPDEHGVVSISGDSVTSGSFVFSATDSRGYITSLTQNKTLVPYINLTINPSFYRPSPVSGQIAIGFSGNYFNGSFGAKSNTLTIRYRYKETSASVWSSWITVPSSNYSIGTQTYSSSSDFLLVDENNSTTGFDYQKAYNFQIQALDGADGTVLTTVSSAQTVQRGIPVFDWGENDFRFNVPVYLGEKPVASVPMGHVDATSTSTVFTATVDGITELKNGVWCYLTNGVVTSAKNCTLNINNLGAKPLYGSMAAATRSTTIFNINYTMLFIYNETRVEGGCWDVFYGYNSDTNTIAYNIRDYQSNKVMKSALYRYMFCFTALDGTLIPSCGTSNSTSTSKTLTTESFDPFAPIYYYTTTTTVAADASPGASYMYTKYYDCNMRYAWNVSSTQLTAKEPVYIKCSPQTNGTVKLAGDDCIVQSLPTSADGYVYIFLGYAHSAYQIELSFTHQIYCYREGGIQLWTGVQAELDIIKGQLSQLLSSAT